jgi:hypothetical protein
MRKILIMTLIGLMMIPTMTAFADVVTAVPVLISAPVEEKLKEGFEKIRGFVISYENQTLTIEVDGQEYPVTVFDRDNAYAEELGALKSKDFIEIMAEYGEATFYLSEIIGVSPLMDGPANPVETTLISLYLGETMIESDVNITVIDGITMIPLRASLEALGYEVKWNGMTQAIEIIRGAQWTSITLGENAYFRNRMAPSPLSSAPVAVSERTLVPVEFFAEILGIGIEVENGNVKLMEEEMAIHRGYVEDMQYDETGALRITISSVEGSEDMMYHTIIHTSKAFTIFQKTVVKGEFINVISPPIMTMNIPGQTSGIVIY